MWIARVLNLPDSPVTLIQSPEGELWRLNLIHPDIWAIAIWIRNRPGVYRMATIDPFNDHIKSTMKYDEYWFQTFPF